MNRTLRTAVIGAGYFGRFHAQKYAAMDRATLIAIVDADRTRASAVAAETGSEALADHRDLRGRVDAVSIAAPTSLHHELARWCLDQGLHVFVEKPIATTVEEGLDLVERAQARNLVLQVGHIQRVLFRAFDIAHRMPHPRHVELTRIHPYRPRAVDVGVVLDLMIHDIDLALAAMRAPVASVEATVGTLVSKSEDFASARLRFADGRTAQLTASRIASRVEREMRLFAADGVMSVDLQARKAVIARPRAGDLANEDVTLPPGDDLASELSGFVASIIDGAPPLVSGEDGVAALAVARDILAAAQPR